MLTLIGLRARTPDGTAALSGFSQSSGYLLAALGPFAVGALHDATGSWTCAAPVAPRAPSLASVGRPWSSSPAAVDADHCCHGDQDELA